MPAEPGLSDFFASGRAVDVVLGFMALEGLALIAWRRATGRGLAPGAVASLLLPGMFLLLALRGALTGAQWPWMAGFLLASLLAHIADLRRRW